MYINECEFIENTKSPKILALFSTLEEKDKDIVITITELLVEKWKTNIIWNNAMKTGEGNEKKYY